MGAGRGGVEGGKQVGTQIHDEGVDVPDKLDDWRCFGEEQGKERGAVLNNRLHPVDGGGHSEREL